MSRFKQNIMRHAKEQENRTHPLGKKRQATETSGEIEQMLISQTKISEEPL